MGKKFMLFGLALTALFLLAACGGGGSGGPEGGSVTTVSAAGLWQGTLLEDGSTYNTTGLIHNGGIIAIGDDGIGTYIYAGTYTMSGNTLNASVTVYPSGSSPVGTATITGTVSEKNTINATFSTSYNTTGTINLSYDNTYDRGGSLNTVAGNWITHEDEVFGSIAVAADGNFTGSDADGCLYSGNFTVPDPAVNIYNVDLSVTNCGIANGNYSGLAGVYDEAGTNDGLSFAVSDGNYLVLLSLIRP